MDEFLETYSLLKLNLEEAENQNKPITTNEIEEEIKEFPENKRPGPDGFTSEF